MPFVMSSAATDAAPGQGGSRSTHSSFPGEVRELSNEPLYSLAHEGDGDFLISGHNPAANNDPLTKSTMGHPITSRPLRRSRCGLGGGSCGPRQNRWGAAGPDRRNAARANDGLAPRVFGLQLLECPHDQDSG